MGYALLPSDKKTGATKALFRNIHVVIGAWPHAALCPGPEECRITNLVIRDHLKEPWSNPMVEHSPIAPVAQQLQGADIWGLALTETLTSVSLEDGCTRQQITSIAL
ncbi:uncharacterized protein APUU_30336S [Aspergillus puulaauensis]|uniref:Uncharacterized protein n=1 Tax=Aspergillus puulaauensis TaxID=1220207 RepID=A0A7R7XII6_9EURO|nr:uncharacterized protein APUU_30336S [Aspergillus puulaauensis]BCS22111.1 hypothetical protein APUU_30336S [Aspergillus puulaauensis]